MNKKSVYFDEVNYDGRIKSGYSTHKCKGAEIIICNGKAYKADWRDEDTLFLGDKVKLPIWEDAWDFLFNTGRYYPTSLQSEAQAVTWAALGGGILFIAFTLIGGK